MLLNNQWVSAEIKRKSKVTRDKWKWESVIQIMGSRKRSPKRYIYNGTILPLEERKISNKQSNLISKGTVEKKKERRNIN